MYKIKVSIPGFGNNLNISQYIGNESSNIVGGYKFFVNDPECTDPDFWFVIDDLQNTHEKSLIDPNNVIYLTAEAIYSAGYFDSSDKIAFIQQFSKIFTCHDILKKNVYSQPPFLGWMINANHGPSIFQESRRDINWLKKIDFLEKTKKVSVICSSKILTKDHYVRFKFVSNLKAHFGDDLDWYGNGVRPVEQKWDAIAPYKYHIVLENQSRNNVITEKIYDSYLGLAYPIYWGAPNLDDYFHSSSFARIDPYNLNGSIATIERLIESDVCFQKRDLLISSKNDVLETMNPFVRMCRIADEHNDLSCKKLVTLNSMKWYRNNSSVGLAKYIVSVLANKLATIDVMLNK